VLGVRNDLHFATGENDAETPADFIARLEARIGRSFGCDVAATRALAKAPTYFGPDHEDPDRRDCLAVPWPTDVLNWMNPPYGREEHPCKQPYDRCVKKRCKDRGHHNDVYIPGCYDFVAKVAREHQRGAEIWALLAARTDTAWFHEFLWDEEAGYWRPGVRGQFLQERVKFLRGGVQDHGAPFPSLLVHFFPL
jgi:DNA N-6-adenine-methyltransferase (Dam)